MSEVIRVALCNGFALGVGILIILWASQMGFFDERGNQMMIKCHLGITPSKDCYEVCMQSRRCEALKIWESKIKQMTITDAIKTMKYFDNCFGDYKPNHEAIQMAIKALSCSEKPNRSDCISRQDAIDALAKFVPYVIDDVSTESYTNGLTDAYNLICQLPSVQPERQKGEWIEISPKNHTYKCSECGKLLVNVADGRNNVSKHYPYCHCGADMRGEQDDE